MNSYWNELPIERKLKEKSNKNIKFGLYLLMKQIMIDQRYNLSLQLEKNRMIETNRERLQTNPRIDYTKKVN